MLSSDDEDFGLKMGQVVARCWVDDAFKSRLMAEPRATLAEYEISVPDGMNLQIVEDTSDKQYFVLPPSPADGQAGSELSNIYGANNWMEC